MQNDLYGVTSNDLDAVKAAVESVFECELQAHESAYHGLYYRAVLMNREEVVVKRNLDPLDGEPAELKYAAYPIIVYVNHTDRTAQLREALMNAEPAITLLRSR